MQLIVDETGRPDQTLLSVFAPVLGCVNLQVESRMMEAPNATCLGGK